MQHVRANRGTGAGGRPDLLILFDIDGTLLLTDGAGREAFRTALLAIFGTAGPLDEYQFHGKTDPQIAEELLTAAGLDRSEIRRRMPTLWPIYLESLERELGRRRNRDSVVPLPGVPGLLAELEARTDVALGLVTGNLEPAARLKLAAAGVVTPFAVGGFGSDAAVRTEIARIVLERARTAWGRAFGAGEVVVVGDTPADVACARTIGGRAVAVATGRHTGEELELAGADLVLPDLADTGRVIDGLLGLDGAGPTNASPGDTIE